MGQNQSIKLVAEADSLERVATLHAGRILQIIRDDLGDTAVGYLSPAIQFAQQLPAYSGNILEWHLSNEAAPFDFSCRINSTYDKPLLSLTPLARSDHYSFVEEGYQRLLTSSGDQFRFGIENIWFEYDAPYQEAPALFFDLHRNVATEPQHKWQDLKIICGYFQQELDDATWPVFRRIHEARQTVVYAGLMFSRTAKALRFTIGGMAPHQLSDVLKMLGWYGNYELVRSLTNDYRYVSQKTMLSVDVDDQVNPRIGIEIFTEDVAPLLEKLAGRLVNEEQRNLLAQWQGKSNLPSEVARNLARMHRRLVTHIDRRINHIKFVLDKERITVKAYLYFCF